MSQPQDPSRPPLLRLLDQLVPVLKKAHGTDPVFLSAAEKREAIAGLDEAAELLATLNLRLLATAQQGDDACLDAADRNVVDLAARLTRRDKRGLARDHRLAVSLDTRWRRVLDAMRAGAVSVAQAREIVRALEQLPEDLPPEVLVRAEEYLIACCTDLTPDQLRRVGRGVLEHVAPEVADDEEGKRLDNQEKKALDGLSLHVHRHADGVEGKSRAILTGPDEMIDRLTTYLDAYANPRKLRKKAAKLEMPDGLPHPASEAGERLPLARRRGLAFVSLLEAMDPKRLPIHGGDATTVIVTIDLEQLRQQLGVGRLVNGDSLSAGAIRRLACKAKILPAVLGGRSEVLDLGRAKRLFNAPQRKAKLLDHETCQAEGCDLRGDWSEMHHEDPWSEGGATDLARAVLACSFHHHRLHDERYEHEFLVDGTIRFRMRR